MTAQRNRWGENRQRAGYRFITEQRDTWKFPVGLKRSDPTGNYNIKNLVYSNHKEIQVLLAMIRSF